MKNIFKYDFFYKNIYEIPIDFLSNFDIIIFDADNTLVAPETTTMNTNTFYWLANIPQEKRYILSNSRSIRQRSKKLEEKFNIVVIDNKFKKPNPLLCSQIRRITTNKKTLLIGDKIFTDIIFGNMCNFTTILIQQHFEEKYKILKLYNWLQKVFIN